MPTVFDGEAAPGHTFEKHVVVTNQQLRDREFWQLEQGQLLIDAQ